MEPLLRTLAVIAALAIRLISMLMAMLLRGLAVRTAWRRISTPRIHAAAIGLLLARLRRRAIRRLSAMAVIRSAATLARLGVRMRVTVAGLPRAIFAVTIPLHTMAMLL